MAGQGRGDFLYTAHNELVKMQIMRQTFFKLYPPPKMTAKEKWQIFGGFCVLAGLCYVAYAVFWGG